MKKLLLFTGMLLFVVNVTFSQTDVYVNNCTITIDSSSQVSIKGSISFSGQKSKIKNDGVLDLSTPSENLRADFMNNSSDTLCSGKGTYKFSGDNYQHIAGTYGVKFYNLEIENGTNSAKNGYSIRSFVNLYVGDSLKNDGKLTLKLGNLLIDTGKSIFVLNNKVDAIVGGDELANVTGKISRRVNFLTNSSKPEYIFPLANNNAIYFPAKIVIPTDKLYNSNLKEVTISSANPLATDLFKDSTSVIEGSDKTLVYDNIYDRNLWRLSFNSGVKKINYDIYLSVKNQDDIFSQKYGILSREKKSLIWAAVGKFDAETSPYRTLDDFARRLTLNKEYDFAIGRLNRFNDALKVINLLTPTGTENNEFVIEGLEKLKTPLAVTIFNRWGVIIYRSEDYQSEKDKWKGQSNTGITLGGNELPSGTYFYVLKNNGEDIKTGFVHLQRD